MKILDLSAGKRSMWFDKKHPAALFVDHRPEVQPDVVADTRALPKDLGSDFDLVVFDPPHLNFGANGIFAKEYGHYSAREIRQLVTETAREAWRVAKPEALMAFKWNDHSMKLATILALLEPYWEPLFGTRAGRGSARGNATYWTMLRRRAA